MSASEAAVATAAPVNLTPRLFSPAYRWYALGVLFLAYVFNFIDRSILAELRTTHRQRQRVRAVR